jgi:hypothetical protein
MEAPALGVIDGVVAHGGYQEPGSLEQRIISALIVGAPVPVR